MEFNRLGHTGLYVSRLCLGTMTFGGGGTAVGGLLGALGPKEADKLVAQSIEAGINFFDTANVYSAGESETLLGKALGEKRQEVVVATKFHGRMGPGPNQVGSSRVAIMNEVHASLRRLGTDYIDLYQIHGFDRVTPLEETLRTLDDLVKTGKVRYIGASNFAAWQVMKALGISAQQNLERFTTLQAYYSLAGRDLEHEIVPMLQDQNLGLLTWSPLAGGFLSGKFTRQNAGDKDSRRMKFDFPPVDVERSFDIIEVMKKISDRHDGTVAQIALAWQLHQPFVTSVILGAKSEAQLQDNLGSARIRLSAEDLRELDEVSRIRDPYPNWMFKFQSDRAPGSQRDMSKVLKPTV